MARIIKRATLKSKAQERNREIDKIRAEVAERYGPRTMRTADKVEQPGRIPTGIFVLDQALCGGLPENRVIQIQGRKHGGKTMTAELVIAAYQRFMETIERDSEAAFIDVEATRDTTWGEKLGVDNSKLNYIETSVGEHALEITEGLVRTLEIGLIVVDSIAALTSHKEQERAYEDEAVVGGNAKLITSFCRKINMAMVSERKRDHFPTLILINQDRAGIGKRGAPGQEVISHPGAKALEHLISTDIRVSNYEKTKEVKGQTVLDINEHSFKIEKHKLNAGFRKGDFHVRRRTDPNDENLTEGKVDDSLAMLAEAKRKGFYTGGGTKWTLEFGEYSDTYGKADDVIAELNANPEYKWALRNNLIAAHAADLGLKPSFVDYLLTHGTV